MTGSSLGENLGKRDTKAEQTINSEEMSVANAEWADRREWVQVMGVRPTVLIWINDTGSSECLLLKHECFDFFKKILFILNVDTTDTKCLSNNSKT